MQSATGCVGSMGDDVLVDSEEREMNIGSTLKGPCEVGSGGTGREAVEGFNRRDEALEEGFRVLTESVLSNM